MRRRCRRAPVQFLGFFVCIIMAVGSCFAAMNTMYAAVARRSRGNGHAAHSRLHARQHSAQLFSESVLLSLIGGLLACCIVLPLNSVTTSSATSSRSAKPASISASARKSWPIGILFSLILGAVGGLLPARQAAKKEILTALRESKCEADFRYSWKLNSKVFGSTAPRSAREEPKALRQADRDCGGGGAGCHRARSVAYRKLNAARPVQVVQVQVAT